MANFKTFKADILNTSETNATKVKATLYQRYNPDGIMEMRIDSEYEVAKVKHKTVFINNREGQWQLTPTTAIKMEFQEALTIMAQQAATGVKKGELTPGTYSLSETAMNDKSYWVVKAVVSEDVQKKVQEALESSPLMQEMRKRTPSLKSIPFPSVTLYRIGKEDSIIYSTQQYDDDGNRISDVTYESVQINLPLADDIFAIPQNLKRKVARTRNDYATMMAETR